MKRLLLPLAPALLLAGCAAPVQHVTLLHWNDFHARNLPEAEVVAEGDTVLVGGYARLAGMVREYREDGGGVLALHAGDDFQGSPISGFTRGRSQVELLNIVRPDAFTIGNHEFDYSADTLRRVMAKARFPVLLANVEEEGSGRLLFAPDTVLEAGSVRVGIVGLMTPAFREITTTSATEGLRVTDPLEAARRSLARLERASDVQVVLSHMGFRQDSLLAAMLPGYEVILGGHSHTELRRPVVVGGTVIAQAGDNGRFLGVLELEVDAGADSLFAWEGRLEPVVVAEGPLHEEVAAAIAKQEARFAELLDEEIATLETDWRRSRGESNLGNWVADAIAAGAGVQIGFVNNGGLRDDVEAGPLTVREIYQVAPFGNEIIAFQLTGDELRRYVLHERTTREHLQVGGLRYRVEGGEVVELTVEGEPVLMDSSYTAATLSYVTDHFEMFFGFSPEGKALRGTGILDREALIEAARRQESISSRVEGRSVVDGRNPVGEGRGYRR